MHARENALNKWLKNILDHTPFKRTLLAGDASFRRYFRLYFNDATRVIMDAPPDKETLTSFISICKTLSDNGIHTPTIYAFDLEQGFMLLEDLGDQLLLQKLSQDNADALYKTAINTLLQLQQCSTTNPKLPVFDRSFMLQEISLFREWFLEGYLKKSLDAHEEALLEKSFNWLTEQLLEQPQVFIHRDYHSRNLMIVDDHTPFDIAVIDFQDAMRGPITYDLVSLLKDCYVQWPRQNIRDWITYFYQKSTLRDHYTLLEFTRAFDLCGLQRHLKVLGIFCRLYLRDNKSGYLQDLPRTFNYVMATLECYRELQPFYQFMQETIYPLFIEKVPS